MWHYVTRPTIKHATFNPETRRYYCQFCFDNPHSYRLWKLELGSYKIHKNKIYKVCSSCRQRIDPKIRKQLHKHYRKPYYKKKMYAGWPIDEHGILEELPEEANE